MRQTGSSFYAPSLAPLVIAYTISSALAVSSPNDDVRRLYVSGTDIDASDTYQDSYEDRVGYGELSSLDVDQLPLDQSERHHESEAASLECGKSCTSRNTCQEGLTCMSSRGFRVCALKVEFGGSCADKCALCHDGGTCADDGSGGRRCIPHNMKAAKRSSKCGEPCSSSRQCSGKLQCLHAGKSRVCGIRAKHGGSCSRAPCFQNCRLCSATEVCGMNSKCVAAEMHVNDAQCGRPCSATQPCAKREGLICSQKGLKRGFCSRQIDLNGSCDSLCNICVNGYICQDGVCRPRQGLRKTSDSGRESSQSAAEGSHFQREATLGMKKSYGNSYKNAENLGNITLEEGYGTYSSNGEVETRGEQGSRTNFQRGEHGIQGRSENHRDSRYRFNTGDPQGGGRGQQDTQPAESGGDSRHSLHAGKHGGKREKRENREGGDQVDSRSTKGSDIFGKTHNTGEDEDGRSDRNFTLSGGQPTFSSGNPPNSGLSRDRNEIGRDDSQIASFRSSGCDGFSQGLHVLDPTSVNKTVLLSHGEAATQASFVYIPAPEEFVSTRAHVAFDITVNDTTIATRAKALYSIKTSPDARSERIDCYQIGANLTFDANVGSVSFRLTANTVFGKHFVYGYYLVAGLVIGAPVFRKEISRGPIISGKGRKGLTIGAGPHSGGVGDDGSRYEVLPIFYQSTKSGSSDSEIVVALERLQISVTEYQSGNMKVQKRDRGLLSFQNSICNPLGPAVFKKGEGWSFGKQQCDIALQVRESESNIGAVSKRGRYSSQAFIVIRVPGGGIGTSIVALSLPASRENNISYETTLRISSNYTTPILLLDSTKAVPKPVLNELDYYGGEILNYTMRNTKFPQQLANCSEYYLVLSGSRFAVFEDDLDNLGVLYQNVSFVSAGPNEVNNKLSDAITAQAISPMQSPGSAELFGGPNINGSRDPSRPSHADNSNHTAPSNGESFQSDPVDNGVSANGSKLFAFVRIGNDTSLTRATNLPPRASVISSFASRDLARIDSNKTLANQSLVLRVPVRLRGYSSRNFSEFKSASFKAALQTTLAEVKPFPVSFFLDRLQSSGRTVTAIYEAYIETTEDTKGILGQRTIRNAIERAFYSGEIARRLRLLYDQVEIVESGVSFVNNVRLGSSIQGLGSSLAIASIVAIFVVISIPAVALCSSIMVASRIPAGSGSSSSPGGDTDRLPPIDELGLYIASDGHGRGVQGVKGSGSVRAAGDGI